VHTYQGEDDNEIVSEHRRRLFQKAQNARVAGPPHCIEASGDATNFHAFRCELGDAISVALPPQAARARRPAADKNFKHSGCFCGNCVYSRSADRKTRNDQLNWSPRARHFGRGKRRFEKPAKREP
jgi:hypothetical protein